MLSGITRDRAPLPYLSPSKVGAPCDSGLEECSGVAGDRAQPVAEVSSADEDVTDKEEYLWIGHLSSYAQFSSQVPSQEQHRIFSSITGDRAASITETMCMFAAGQEPNLSTRVIYEDIMIQSRGTTVSLPGLGFEGRRARKPVRRELNMKPASNASVSMIHRCLISFLHCLKLACEERTWLRQVKLGTLKVCHRWIIPSIKWLLPVPRKFSWLRIMGTPIAQTASDSCAVVASTVCIEALHRLEFECLHGVGSFICKAAYPRKLRSVCRLHKIWSEEEGASVELVLEIVKKKGGVLTTNMPLGPLLMPLTSFCSYELYNEDDPHKQLVDERKAARIIYMQGPCVGSLFVDSVFFNYGLIWLRDDLDMDVYKGVVRDKSFRRLLMGLDRNAGNHAVVCYGYRFLEGELQLRILDNQSLDGPRRWVAYKAFHRLVSIHVAALDRPVVP